MTAGEGTLSPTLPLSKFSKASFPPHSQPPSTLLQGLVNLVGSPQVAAVSISDGMKPPLALGVMVP